MADKTMPIIGSVSFINFCIYKTYIKCNRKSKGRVMDEFKASNTGRAQCPHCGSLNPVSMKQQRRLENGKEFIKTRCQSCLNQLGVVFNVAGQFDGVKLKTQGA
jgi:ssDNA-binding Zn-finger/Zn-ribbon topoisomerase 1